MTKPVKIILKSTAAAAGMIIIFIIAVWAGVFGHLQTKKELRSFRNATASIVLSEEGREIGKFFSENRTNVSQSNIPSHLFDALIATEDARFYEHKGIDTRSFFRVLLKSVLLRDRSSGGGSTITQQLAKNMFGRKQFGPLSILVNKAREALLARRIERTFSKEEILTLYLNSVAFGENVYGIEAAAGRYFSKKTGSLEIQESAVLIGMLKANTLYNPRLNPENSRTRRNVVLKQMEKYNYLEPGEADSLCSLPLVSDYNNIEASGPADYFLVRVRAETEKILNDLYTDSGRRWNIEEDGLVITTTLDYSLQNYAVLSFSEHLSVMQKRLREQYQSASGKRQLAAIAGQELKRLNLTTRSDEIITQRIFDWDGPYTGLMTVSDSLSQALTLLHAGLLAIDPVTGAVKAWVGGIDFRSQPYDQILARRQMASVFKPVLYAAALEEGMEPCQYLENDSVVLSGFDNWSPENFDHSYGGRYSLAGALAQSMNIPTFSLYLKVGFEKLNALWKQLGFSFPLDNTPSLALGTGEATIQEVAEAYSCFANGGFKTEIRIIRSVSTADGEILYQREPAGTGERVLTERSAILMSAMLQKAIKEGTGTSVSSLFGIDIPLAGKTGTSQNYSDAWFAAFTPKLVIVTRAGASSQAIHFNNGAYGSGSTLALPLAALTLKKVLNDRALTNQYISPFPELPPELRNALNCPDFRDLSVFDRIIDIFQSEKDVYDKDDKKLEKGIRSILDRIFRK